METFAFEFDDRFRWLLAAEGITPRNTWVRVTDDRFVAHCSIFTLETPRSNIAGVEVTGPHRPIKAIGIRTSLTDRGLTFGTNAERMVCVRFIEPVRISPFDLARHPGLSVSVADVEGLATLLRR